MKTFVGVGMRVKLKEGGKGLVLDNNEAIDIIT